MANRSISTRRAGAATSRSGQAVTVFSGNGFSVAGGAISSTSTITLGIVVPGETSSNSAVTPTGGGATITAITKTDSNFTASTGNISPAGYFTVTGTGFESNSNLYIGGNNFTSVYYSSTELRVNLSSRGSYLNPGSYSLNYFSPNTSKFGSYASGISLISSSPTVDYLVVAGGGGGSVGGGGGGGAGGLIQANSIALTPGVTYTITVGAGGTGGTGTNQPGNIGTNSSISGSGLTTVTAVRGGFGGAPGGAGTYAGAGGSGGGAARAGPYIGGNATVGQGFAGGNVASPNNNASAGGGGAGAKGQDRVSSTVAGNGGAGLSSSITGSATFYAGGGGGGGYTITTGGTGGSGGGGAGKASGNGGDGTVNTGGGGGASAFEGGSSGGAGGSGVVILRFSVDAVPISTTGSPTITVSGSNFVYKFTQSGTITW